MKRACDTCKKEWWRENMIACVNPRCPKIVGPCHGERSPAIYGKFEPEIGSSMPFGICNTCKEFSDKENAEYNFSPPSIVLKTEFIIKDFFS